LVTTNAAVPDPVVQYIPGKYMAAAYTENIVEQDEGHQLKYPKTIGNDIFHLKMLKAVSVSSNNIMLSGSS